MALKLNTITDENQLFREFIKDNDDVEAPMVKSVFKAVAFGAGSGTRYDSFVSFITFIIFTLIK